MKAALFLDFIVLVTVVFCALNFGEATVGFGQNGGHTASSVNTVRLTREFLLAQRSVAHKFPPNFDSLPDEMKPDSINDNANYKRKRGKRGGVRRRLRRQRTLLPLPSIIYANTRSLRPKLPNPNFFELCANVSFLSEYRDACVMCFSETWFDSKISDDSLHIDGFGTPYRGDRADFKITGKHCGGGVCVYINESYCNKANVTLRKQTSSPDVDILALSMRPKYLPREFGQIFLTTIYAHPSADQTKAATEIADVIRDLQRISPDAPNFIIGDFNKGFDKHLRHNLTGLKQYITCNTRLDSRPDSCYGNIPDAYRSFPLPNIGQSDHSTVHLVPAYRPLVQRVPIEKRKVKVYSDEKIDELKFCFDTTDWDVMIDSCSDIDSAVDVISCYISFCEDTIIPTKEIKVFPNNKPYISKSLKHTINQKKKAFMSGDRRERKDIQRQLTAEIREGKKEYRQKVEKRFEEGEMRGAWEGLKILTGQKKSTASTSGMTERERLEFSDKLNDFYCRFERDDLGEELDDVLTRLRDQTGDSMHEHDFKIDGKTVENVLRKINPRKACGPDNIGGRILRMCCEELSYVFSTLFSWSLRDCIVPSLWKTSVICPVPKNRSPSELNDYRPVALTSIVMKCFEKLVLRQLLSQTCTHTDPYQFAYRQNRSTDDATISLLHNAYSHLEKPGSYVRILFIDFSSAFNTIQPHLMALKLLAVNVNPKLILWICSFLLNRSQSVRFQNMLSSSRSTSTGAPQGTVLSPVLFTLYTNDCRGSDICPLIKYSDDTALEDLSNCHFQFLQHVQTFTKWCRDNFLDLNVRKTKEMVIDFRRASIDDIPDLFIEGSKVERVHVYKYLGTTIDDRFSFDQNTDLIVQKCQSRIYCLQKLRSLGVNFNVLGNFYRSFIESIITFGFLCWFENLSLCNKKRLERIVHVCSKVVGMKQKSMPVLYECRIVKKGNAIVQDSSHILSQYFEWMPSGRRFRVPKARTLRMKNTFVSRAIANMNKRKLL